MSDSTDSNATVVERPAGNASHAEWVTYAVSQGMDPTEADDTSRDDLRELYPAEEPPPVKHETREAPKGGRRIKYMGSSDVRELRAGETAQKTMPKINRTIRWNKENFWIVDTSLFPEVSEQWWDHLVEFDNFEDVTDMEGSPLNRHQEVFSGMKKIAGNREPAPGEMPTPQKTTGQDAIPDFFDSRAARLASNVEG